MYLLPVHTINFNTCWLNFFCLLWHIMKWDFLILRDNLFILSPFRTYNTYLQYIIHNNVIFIRKLFLYSKLHFYIRKEIQIFFYHENLYNTFACMKQFSPKNFFKKFCKGVLYLLSRCCFRHLVEHSVLYNKNIYITFT